MLTALLSSTSSDTPRPAENTSPTVFDVTILVEYGLWSPELPLPAIAPPPPATLPPADSYGFRCGRTLVGETFKTDFVSLDFVRGQGGAYAHVELLRALVHDEETLTAAATRFNRMMVELSPGVAYDAARLWVAMHGARLLDWNAVPVAQVKEFFRGEQLPMLHRNHVQPMNERVLSLSNGRRRGKSHYRGF
jgi:hypothetical protein